MSCREGSSASGGSVFGFHAAAAVVVVAFSEAMKEPLNVANDVTVAATVVAVAE